MSQVSVVIPAKNEEKGLSKVLPELVALNIVGEVIVVDDGSTDNTVKICSELQVSCISHPYSMGNGAAIKTGARAASSDVIIFMDADGQHQPKDIERIIEKMSEGYDMVVGARDRSGQASYARYLANGFYNKFASWMSEHKVEDLTSGFRAVNAEKFRQFLYMLPNGFSYPTTSTMAFLRSGYSVGFVDIDVLDREGKSHIRLWKDGIKFLLIIFKITTLYSPLKLFSGISASLFVSGVAYYVYTYLSFERFTNMGLALVLSAMLVFLIGLISEQISTLFYKR
ncbi:glycosyltransferase [Pseudoteredinibacter isoporae]|uniref:Glycosyltransferase involved in cell wall biosynthesis n=1 Tax=Pseudoteredinibacter isoporae TaxID=570281 RepID=A0A7X0JUW6_9GAMM|nr:glycosyltransferase involved in cell wall biosynthesis [Pseudoteredinibacter isoporae]NHO88240.1 glycosyltransferase family 2 protein [Pseudoteredinibacter isoporae]NIB23429.1 glycosyltransferase family 2 protein [Pseudoteredinibacter isoporae]